MKDMCYDRPLNRKNRNNLEYTLYESCNSEQAIEKLTQPFRRRKHWYIRMAHNTVKKTGRPFCAASGLINPIKLDISNLNRKGLADKK